MSKQIDSDYNQQYIFPITLEQWIDERHPARFIREFVESLDLANMGFAMSNTDEGRPAYSVALLLKVWLYGLFMKIMSSRGLEHACYDILGMIWLAGTHKPDHNTIWRFYRDNKDKIKKIFNRTLRYAIKLEMIGFVLHAIDGTKIAANVSRQRALHKEDLDYILNHLDEIVNEKIKVAEGAMEEEHYIEMKMPEKLKNKKYLKAIIREKIEEEALSNAPLEEIKQEVKKVLQEKKEGLESKELKHESVTDNDARMMKVGSYTMFAYNAQAVVDEKSKLIVACDVVQDESDNNQLTNMMEHTQQQVDQVADITVADGGYFSGEELQKAADKGYEVLVPIRHVPKTSDGQENKYHITNFKYDKEKDMFICPEGKELPFKVETTRTDRKHNTKRYQCYYYKECPHRQQCSKDKKGRKLEISPFSEIVDKQKQKQQVAAYKKMLSKRKEIIEHVFGIIKCIMGFNKWTVRGLNNVKAQWYYLCTAYNLKKIYRQWLKINTLIPEKALIS